ncbi:MAG: carbonic anhydrase [Rhodospirillales bacterium]|nr:carbonic anhydrase [Rhodospirillales bacterium]
MRDRNQAVTSVNRRRFLDRSARLAALGAAGTAASASGLLSQAASPQAAGKNNPPGNDDPPEDGKAALERLMAGNARHVQNKGNLAATLTERPVLTGGQAPYAAILSCADSRVVPEFIFDAGPGSLFVIRVAGNVLTDEGLASLEYAIEVLGTKLILILGHEGCGAVTAAIEVVEKDARLPGHLPGLAELIRPAVLEAQANGGAGLDNAIAWNVRLERARARAAAPIVSAAVASGRVELAGGVYSLTDGSVRLLD